MTTANVYSSESKLLSIVILLHYNASSNEMAGYRNINSLKPA